MSNPNLMSPPELYKYILENPEDPDIEVYRDLLRCAWIKALKSGKYEKGKRRLKQEDVEGNLRYCCLGVLYEVCGISSEKTCMGFYKFRGNSAALDGEIFDVLGFKGNNPFVNCSINGKETALAILNDNHADSLEDMGQIISDNYEEIFN